MKFMKVTLLYVIDNDKILLGEKLRGFGAGKFNGIGGKVDPGETISEAMIRETKEEIGVVSIGAKCVAKLIFNEILHGEDTRLETYVYITNKISGEPKISEEMKPVWFDVNNIPYEKMFDDDKFWLPRVIAGKCIEAEFWFDENYHITKHQVAEVEKVFVG